MGRRNLHMTKLKKWRACASQISIIGNKFDDRKYCQEPLKYAQVLKNVYLNSREINFENFKEPKMFYIIFIKSEQITKIYSYSCTVCFMLMQSSSLDYKSFH